MDLEKLLIANEKTVDSRPVLFTWVFTAVGRGVQSSVNELLPNRRCLGWGGGLESSNGLRGLDLTS